MIVRPSRPPHLQPCFLSRSRRAALIAASVASVLLGTFVSSDAIAQASSASAVSEASAPAAASVAAAVTQYSVKPGQSLSDIASQITGSNDRATREKMSRALFDANPNAFMGHDPSRLKLGSVLNVTRAWLLPLLGLLCLWRHRHRHRQRQSELAVRQRLLRRLKGHRMLSAL